MPLFSFSSNTSKPTPAHSPRSSTPTKSTGLLLHNYTITPSSTNTDSIGPFDCSFPEHAFIGIAGANGAGKSTLLKALLGITPNTYRVSGKAQYNTSQTTLQATAALNKKQDKKCFYQREAFM